MTKGKKKYTVRHRLVIDYIHDAVEAESEKDAVEKVHKMVGMPFLEWEEYKKLKSRSERIDLGWSAKEEK